MTFLLVTELFCSTCTNRTIIYLVPGRFLHAILDCGGTCGVGCFVSDFLGDFVRTRWAWTITPLFPLNHILPTWVLGGSS